MHILKTFFCCIMYIILSFFQMAVNIASNVPATGEGSLAPDLGKL